MKRILSVILAAVMLFALVSCGANDSPAAPDTEKPTAGTEPSVATVSDDGSASDTEVKAMKIKITIGGRTMTATLSDNASAKEFYELLEKGPVTIDMHDYGHHSVSGRSGDDLLRREYVELHPAGSR